MHSKTHTQQLKIQNTVQLHTQEQHYKNVLVKTVQRTFERRKAEYRKDIKWKYNSSKNAINRKEIAEYL